MAHQKRTIGDVYEDLARRSFTMFLRRYLDRVLLAPPDIAMPDIDLPDEKEEQAG